MLFQLVKDEMLHLYSHTFISIQLHDFDRQYSCTNLSGSAEREQHIDASF